MSKMGPFALIVHCLAHRAPRKRPRISAREGRNSRFHWLWSALSCIELTTCDNQRTLPEPSSIMARRR